MKIFLIIFLSAALYMQAQSILKPSLVAITSEDAAKSAKWYEDVLGFKTYKEMNFPEYDSLIIFFLRKDEFEFEIIQKRTSFSIKDVVPGYNPDNTPLIGFSKLAFKVKDIKTFFENIKSKNVNIIMGVTYDETFNEEFFMITDPDGNLLQFVEPEEI